MTGKKTRLTSPGPETKHPHSLPPPPGSHSRIVAMDDSRGLDTVQLARLEEAFRRWAQDAARRDVLLSRQRILLIFLLIRYTGARLNEVLALHPYRDIDLQRHAVVFRGGADEPARQPREVQIPETLSREIEAILAAAPAYRKYLGNLLTVDPAHVRRKFYERAAACGFAKELGGPDTIRKSRAVELMRNNLPLPVVQRILGHSSPNLTASFVSFSDEDMQQVTRFFLERESRRQTSARNAFFGKISAIEPGDIQAKVEMVTLGGTASPPSSPPTAWPASASSRACSSPPRSRPPWWSWRKPLPNPGAAPTINFRAASRALSGVPSPRNTS